jgi:uracil-DNA glycosylase family 4
LSRASVRRVDSFARLERAVISCRLCPRLVAHREEIGRAKRRAYAAWDYWARPVPGFGDPRARLLIVGLAPGAHGSNRTGRMFTGDASGDFFYPCLHHVGLASQPDARSRDDGLELHDCYVTAVARCAPPANKPTPAELARCRPYLLRELDLLTGATTILALGRIAFDGVLAAFAVRGISMAPRPKFGHGARNRVGPYLLVSSYHPSRQNTNTGRLTEGMFLEVLRGVVGDLPGRP